MVSTLFSYFISSFFLLRVAFFLLLTYKTNRINFWIHTKTHQALSNHRSTFSIHQRKWLWPLTSIAYTHFRCAKWHGFDVNYVHMNRCCHGCHIHIYTLYSRTACADFKFALGISLFHLPNLHCHHPHFLPPTCICRFDFPFFRKRLCTARMRSQVALPLKLKKGCVCVYTLIQWCASLGIGGVSRLMQFSCDWISTHWKWLTNLE